MQNMTYPNEGGLFHSFYWIYFGSLENTDVWNGEYSLPAWFNALYGVLTQARKSRVFPLYKMNYFRWAKKHSC